MTRVYNPASPGELLREFLGKRTTTELAQHIGVSRATISRTLHGRTAVTMDLSIRWERSRPSFASNACVPIYSRT